MVWSDLDCSSHHRGAVTASGRGTWAVLRSAGCIRLLGLRERAWNQGSGRGLKHRLSRAHSRSDSGGGGARCLPLRLKERMPRCWRECAGLCCGGLIAAVVVESLLARRYGWPYSLVEDWSYLGIRYGGGMRVEYSSGKGKVEGQ